MISYGIDRQTSANYSHMGLGEPADREVKKTFVDFGAIPEANAQLFVASEQEEACTNAGMRRSFCQQARKAGKNGIFVFHFTGHGIKFKGNKDLGEIEESMGLAPVDYSKTKDTLVTASHLKDWLAKCEATKIFLIDSCYAESLFRPHF